MLDNTNSLSRLETYDTLCADPDSLSELVVQDNRLVGVVDDGDTAGRSFQGQDQDGHD